MGATGWLMVAGLGLVNGPGLVRTWFGARADARVRCERTRVAGLRALATALPSGAVLHDRRRDGSRLVIRVGAVKADG